MDSSDLAALVALQASSYVNVTVMAWVVYDYLLTLPIEIKVVWLARWTPGKMLFLFVRYVPFLYLAANYFEFDRSPNEESCLFSVHAYTWLTVIQSLLSDVVMALRTWVLWERNKMVLLIVSLAWVGCLTVAFYYDNRSMMDTGYIALPIPLPFCLLGGVNGANPAALDLRASYIAFGVFELVILAFTLARGFLDWRHGSTAKLLTVLYRDAFIASLCFSAVVLVQIVFTVSGTDVTVSTAISAMWPGLKSIIPGRVILNIRDAALSLDGWDVPTQIPLPPERYELAGSPVEGGVWGTVTDV